MVTIQHRLKRLPPTTIAGETLMLETIYTSYDKAEIDWIEEQYKSAIGDGLVQQFDVKEQAKNHLRGVLVSAV